MEVDAAWPALSSVDHAVKRFGSQIMKGTWWMPWHQEAMKGVGACDKLRLAGKRAFDPEMPEWGNPATVMGRYRESGANAGN